MSNVDTHASLGPRGTDDVDVLDDAGCEQVDAVLKAWRQGDCVVGRHWLLFRIDPARPLTEAGAVAAANSADAAEASALGLIVVTQTCDIVRSCRDRPFIEVSPLVEVRESDLREIQRGHRPSYAFVAGLAERRFVADLDRIMTVEKSVVVDWERTPGCLTDADARRLSQALARKRARVAFPDDFVELASPLMSRMSSKHGRESPEGRALRSLREIRVRAAPAWDAEDVHLTFIFVPQEDEAQSERKEVYRYLGKWLELVPESGRFVSVDGVVQTLSDLTAQDYVESDLLDLDHLSHSGASPILTSRVRRP